jgi:GT2 family glycosyltransferase
LSIVIVSYRCRDHLLACLDSLAAQRDQVDMEVIVVDSASGDDTATAAADRFDWVDVEQLTENIGFGRANNRGFERARGRAVLALNPDTIVPRDSLRSSLDYLWAHPEIGVLSPHLVDTEGRLDRRCKRGYPTLWSSFCYFTTLDRVFRGPRSTRYTMGTVAEDEIGDVESVSGAFMLMRGDALKAVGGFDEQFFMYAEDIDLCLRFIQNGWRVRYWPRVDVIHVGAGSNVDGRRRDEANTAYFRTMAPFIRKHQPGLKGAVTATMVAVLSELLLGASRLRGRLTHTRSGKAPAGDSNSRPSG